MTFIEQNTGYFLLIVFGLLMIVATVLFSTGRKTNTIVDFFVARRNVNWFNGGLSVAASWLWAPALLLSAQIAYEKGLAGTFWFVFPNVVALLLFAFFGSKIREQFTKGFTLPQFISSKLKSETVRKIYLVPYLLYQLMAITVQLFAGGSLLYLLTGIDIHIVMVCMLFIAVAYTLISGFRASVITDVVQMILILGLGGILIPFLWKAAGGLSVIQGGLSGIAGSANIFDPTTAFSFGIVTAIGLIAGALSDQQYWQRSFAFEESHLKRGFIFGAVIFALVPIALSTLGFIAANSSLGITLHAGVDGSLIGVVTIASLLPNWAIIMFVMMLLAGLCSTLDSGLSAISSLWITDIRKIIQEDKRTVLRESRISIVLFGIVGLLIALAVIHISFLSLFHLWWIFNTIAATVFIPTILGLYWSKLSAKGVISGVVSSFGIGLPLFIYGNVIGSTLWIVGSTLFILGISGVCCWVFRKKDIY